MRAVASSPTTSARVVPASHAASVRCAATPRAQQLSSAAGATLLASGLALAVGAGALPAGAVSFKDMNSLTYTQVKGSGLANTCPTIEVAGQDPKSMKAGSYEIKKMCMEPFEFAVKDETQKEKPFVKSKVVTRLTYSLSDMEGTMKVGSGGSIDFQEREGMDFNPVTLMMPGGRPVPFLFTVKALNAQGNTDKFSGDFQVPSYRGGSFLDPKMRGATLGYDSAAALSANPDPEELEKENKKTTKTLIGNASFQVNKYDADTGEIAGQFESIQPSDTDLGAKAPKDVKITGQWYAQL